MNIYQHLLAYLHDDPLLVGTQANPPNGPYSGLLTGGLWNRPLKRPGPESTPTPGSTPAAFGGASEAGRIRYAGVLVDRGETPHFQETWIPTAFQQDVLIYLYATAHEQGKQVLRDASERIYVLLRDYRFLTDAGVYARVFFQNRFGIADSEEFLGAVTDYCRYQVISRHWEAS